ncbi:MAG: adenosine deaminase [Solirubrobacterales bacterium]
MNDTLLESIRRLPKVELHSHLEGSIRADTIMEMARRNEVKLYTDKVEEFYPGDFEQEAFFKSFFGACEAIATPDDCSRAAYEVLSDTVAAGNVRYSEMFFQPTMHPRMKYREMLDGLLDGVRAAETDTGIRCRLIAAINREQSPAIGRQLVQDVIDARCDEVLGVGLDGNPYKPASDFTDAFALAGKHGLLRTAHAGVPVHDNQEVLDVLSCDRVDHGYYIAEEPGLLKRVVEERIHFTACWTLAAEFFPTDPENSPVQAMVSSGMSVSINTDDPQIFRTDIGEEYVRATKALGWDLDTAWARVMDGVDGAWLDESERVELRKMLAEEAKAQDLPVNA